MRPRTILQALFALAILGAGALGARALIEGRPEAPELDLPGIRPVPVGSRIVEPVDLDLEVTGFGELRAAREVALTSELGGRVVSVLDGLETGSTVSKGAVLLSVETGALDSEMAAQDAAVLLARTGQAAAEAELERARAGLRLATERLELLRSEESRWRDLFERGKAERARLDLAQGQSLSAALAEEDGRSRITAAESRIAAADAEIELALARRAVLEERAGRAQVRAPFTGRFVSNGPLPVLGQLVRPMEPVGRLLDTAELRLVLEVHEDDAVGLTVGAPAEVWPSSQPGAQLPGKITAIGAEVRALGRTVQVEARFPNEANLPAGTFARAALAGHVVRGALVVEERSIAFRGGESVVFVVEGPDAEGRYVARSRRIETRTQPVAGGRLVLSGLSPGDRLISGPVELLGDGARVEVEDPVLAERMPVANPANVQAQGAPR